MASPAGVPWKACPWKQGCLSQALQCGGAAAFAFSNTFWSPKRGSWLAPLFGGFIGGRPDVAWKRGASKLCQHSASFQKFEVFPLRFFSNFFFFPSNSWFASLIVRSLAKRASAALALHYWASNKRCGSESSSSSVAQCACGSAAAAVMRVRL